MVEQHRSTLSRVRHGFGIALLVLGVYGVFFWTAAAIASRTPESLSELTGPGIVGVLFCVLGLWLIRPCSRVTAIGWSLFAFGLVHLGLTLSSWGALHTLLGRERSREFIMLLGSAYAGLPTLAVGLVILWKRTQAGTESVESRIMSRPDRVSKAVTLLYVTIGIGVLQGLWLIKTRLDALRLMEEGTFSLHGTPMEARIASLDPTGIGRFIFGLPILALIWFFIFKIGKGRNWARMTFLVLFIIGMPLYLPTLFQNLTADPVRGLLAIGQMVIQIVALVFLFQKSSSDWFREMKAKK